MVCLPLPHGWFIVLLTVLYRVISTATGTALPGGIRPFFSQCYGLQNPGPGSWQLVTISNNETVQKHCKSWIFLRNEPPVLVKGFAHPPDPIIIIINHH